MKLKVTALALAIILGGCAHAGAIQKSPCACEFHQLAKHSYV